MKTKPALFLFTVFVIFIGQDQAQIALHGIPLTLSLALSGGASQSHIQASDLLDSYFKPTANVQYPVGPAIGLDFETRIGRYAAVSIGTQYQQRGQNTGTADVQFSDDIFVHTLQTTARMDYLAVPVIFKGGFSGRRAWVFARAGIEWALLTADSLSWTIDGRSAQPGSDRMPSVDIQGSDFSALVGCEAGMRFGRSGIFISADYLYGLQNISTSLSGNAFNRAYEGCVGYRLFLGK
jgi:Outer membrane protein beta-barrel domain